MSPSMAAWRALVWLPFLGCFSASQEGRGSAGGATGSTANVTWGSVGASGTAASISASSASSTTGASGRSTGASTGAGGSTVGGAPSQCFIDNVLIPSMTPDPANACLACVPTVSVGSWVPADGTPCGGAGVCLSGMCLQNSCLIDGVVWTAGAENPSNSCQVCLGGSAWDNTAHAGGHCGDAGSPFGCLDGGCVYGCPDVTNRTIWAPGSGPNPCSLCEPDGGTTQATDWFLNLPQGTPCDAGPGGLALCFDGQCAM